MVLTCYITLGGTHHTHGLVVRAVAVLELIDGGASSLAQQLVTHTDTTDGLTRSTHLLLDNLDGSLAGIGVARAIGQEQTIEIHISIVIVPGHAYHLDPTVNEAPDDIGLHSAVYQHYLLTGSLVVPDNLLAAHLVNEVYSLVVGLGDIVGLIVKDYLAHHYAMLAQHLGKLARINTCNTGHVLALEPVSQALYSIPVRILLAIVGHDDGRGIDAVALHKGGNTIGLDCKRRHSIISDQRKCQRH